MDAGTLVGQFQPTLRSGETYLSRTHPLVEALAGYLLDTALDLHMPSPAARCGAIRTTAVTTATTVLLTRYRFEISARGQGGHDEQLLAEDLGLAAFQGSPASATWLPEADAGRLLTAIPDSNIPPEQRSGFVRRVVEGAGLIIPVLERLAVEQAAELAAAHRRVRHDAGASSRVSVKAHLPVDVLGVYLYLPA